MGGLVAPLVGAWIEILGYSEPYDWDNVAPLVGAWIEIDGKSDSDSGDSVAPLVGAWIEIILDLISGLVDASRSPCGSVD